MIEIGLWRQEHGWKHGAGPQNDYIPLAIVVMAIAYNAINALLFEGDLLEAGKKAFIEATASIGIHSGVKNSFQKGDVELWNHRIL